MPGVLQFIKQYFHRPEQLIPLETGEAYNMWSSTYDEQTGNLMLDFDEVVFTKLLDQLEIKNTVVYDLGCGTGRHWKKLLEKQPASLTGFDVSAGMLEKLKSKFPGANVKEVTDNCLSCIENKSCDILISTLTIAHILNAREALTAWCRVLKSSADMIITDFHPDALSLGAQRTFNHNNETKAVHNYIHPIGMIKQCLFEHGFRLVGEEHRKVDESVKAYYLCKHTFPIYEQFLGVPVIYGLHFRR